MIKVIVFDFDGVLAESVDIKTLAFAELFRPFGREIERRVIEHHKENGGMSRYDKFRYYYKYFLKGPLDETTFQKLCKEFSSIVLEKVVTSPWVMGTLEYLHDTQEQSLYIVSATPEEEIREIVSRREMADSFKGVFGAPQTKFECLQKIMNFEKCTPNEMVFIGDALNDYKAAIEANCRFIARSNDTDNCFINLENVDAIIPDLTDFEKVISRLVKRA